MNEKCPVCLEAVKRLDETTFWCENENCTKWHVSIDLKTLALSRATLAAHDAKTVRPWKETLKKVTDEIADLIGQSRGVYGLHLSGDVAPWSEIDDGGRFEGWLQEYNAARSLLAQAAPGEAKAGGEPLDALLGHEKRRGM